MSTTGTWIVPTRAFEARLAELCRWKQATAGRLAEFRRWATVGRSLDEQTPARLAHLERRLLAERLTVAFVAEYSRGKSELINAMFFADLGARLLPSGVGRTTLCPTEIAGTGAPAEPALLPIEPAAAEGAPGAPRRTGHWSEILLDPTQPATLAPACEALCDNGERAAAAAAPWACGGRRGRVDIPRWRYAVLNFPHPMLETAW
jgi:hypothetical protein